MMDKISTEYNDAVRLIKSAILDNQLEAAKSVNRQMLALYYGIGKFVSENTRVNAWGKNAIDTISKQLQRELPGLRGFSATSIKKMRTFYEQWSKFVNRPPSAVEMQSADTQITFDWHDFFAISFSHHIEILEKTSTIEERWFYIHQVAIMHWDKYALRDFLKADLFHHQGQISNNFAKTISSTIHAQKAISVFKDDYLLDFLGQLQAYVRMLNDDERKPNENPVIGIVLCKEADKTYVEYLLQDYSQPMGVATYSIMPEQLQKVMPAEEKLLALLNSGS